MQGTIYTQITDELHKMTEQTKIHTYSSFFATLSSVKEIKGEDNIYAIDSNQRACQTVPRYKGRQ